MTTARKAKQKVAPHIRWMIRRDMPEVLAIERTAFFPDHWDEDKFIRVLRNRNSIGMVSEREEQVVGYMIYELNRTSLEILNFAVHQSHQRDGVGTAMAEKLINKLSPQRRSRIVAKASEYNLAAQLFLQAMKFRATEIIKEYYSDQGNADAYVFECHAKDQF